MNACTVVTYIYRFVNPHRQGHSSKWPVSNLRSLPSSSCYGSVLSSSRSEVLHLISGDLNGCLDCLSLSLESKNILILVIHQITAFIYEYRITYLVQRKKPCIIFPLLPDHTIPPTWVKLCKVHPIIETGVPLTPRIDLLMTVHIPAFRHTFQPVEFHLPSHMQLILCTRLHKFYKAQ